VTRVNACQICFGILTRAATNDTLPQESQRGA
jgi:hypothetical protein